MAERTAMFIDVQGFGVLYEKDASSLWGLADLMEGVFRLGQESPRLGISRLFVHHLGDGFVLVDDGGVSNANRLIGVAVALHQFTLVKAGHFCASAIDLGEMADVVGCYPKIVTEARGPHGVVPLGDGLMTIFPVMGTAIINTHRLLTKAHGAVILVPAVQAESLEAGLRVIEQEGVLYIDWMASDTPTIATARAILGLAGYDQDRLWQKFDETVARNACKAGWIARTAGFLRREGRPPQSLLDRILAFIRNLFS